MQSPFIIQRDILYGEPFCDRETEIDRYLSAARMGESLCLISPRRYGKTSLLNQVAGKLEEEGWLTAKVDLMQTLSDVELAKEIERKRLGLLGRWRRVAQKLGKAVQDLKTTKIDLEIEDLHFSLGLGEQEESEGRTLLRKALDRLLELPEVTGMPLMVYFDEFQRVREIDPGGNLEAMIRAVFQERSARFLPMYLGSRRHMLKMMFVESGAPFFKSATVLSLDTLSGRSFISFARDKFDETLGVHFPEELALAQSAFFEGHPHLLNKTAAFLWDKCVRDKLRSVSKAECKEAMLDVIREETYAFIELNRKTPLNRLEVLRQIAVRGTVTKPYSRDFLRACNVSQSQMQKILEALGEDDTIARDDHGIHITDPLERLALRMIGTRDEKRDEIIGDLLERAEVVELA